MQLATTYGLTDWLAIRGSFTADRLIDLLKPEPLGQPVFYNLGRYDFGTGIEVRWGTRWVVTASTELIFRLESETNRETLQPGGLVPDQLGARVVPLAVVSSGARIEYRLFERFLLAAAMSWDLPIGRDVANYEFKSGLQLGLYFYP